MRQQTAVVHKAIDRDSVFKDTADRLDSPFWLDGPSVVMSIRILSITVALCVTSIAYAQPDPRWAEMHKSGDFHCRSEFGLSSREKLYQELNALKRDVESTLAIDANGVIQINFFRNRRSYMQFVGLRHPEGMQRRALFVKGPDAGRVYVYRQLSIETDVRHECTHAVIHNALPYLPLWLDEGLAEYFEVPARERTSSNPHLGRLKLYARFGWKPSLKKLEERDSLSNIKSADYRESWAWVHFMLHGPKSARAVLVRYIDDIQKQAAPGKFSERMYEAIPAADAMLVQHIKAWK